jgi:murein DD-endopeptidase MepM/ murein hydrolase activator NlpD
MDKFKERWGEWLEGLKNTYRLVVMNDNTFEEVGSYRLTRLNVYIMISSIFVVLVCLVTMIIAFTSLKEYIPGYGDVNLKGKSRELEQKVYEVEKELIAREAYIKTVQKVLTGGVDTTNYEAEGEDEMAYDTVEFNVEPIAEDYALRTEIERESMQSLDNSNFRVSQDDSYLEQLYFTTPVRGAIVNDEFQPDKGHLGVDLLGSTGATIYATLSGVIIISDYTFETGYVIGIQHSNNFISFYKHNSKLLKKVGDKVQVGEAIAIIGNTGEFTEGPHLHFELWHNSKPINPREFLVF